MSVRLDALWEIDPADLSDAEHELLLDGPLADLPPLTPGDLRYFASGSGRELRRRARAASEAAARAVLEQQEPCWRALDDAAARLGSDAVLLTVGWIEQAGLPEIRVLGGETGLRLGHGSGTVSVGARGSRVRMAWIGRRLRVTVRGEPLLVELRTADRVVGGKLETIGTRTWTFELDGNEPVRLLAWAVSAEASAIRLDVPLEDLDGALWARRVADVRGLLDGTVTRLDLEAWYDAWAASRSAAASRLTNAAACRLIELASGSAPVPASGDSVCRRYRSMGEMRAAVEPIIRKKPPRRRHASCLHKPKTL
ncbi:MAG: hypothetical protein ACI8PZ_000795 [Myxococcota bacterium]|jgi:hypothetical protein